MNKPSFLKLDLIILSIILVIALAFRLYKINQPLADLHSWRQVDTAAVARNFNKFGFDLLHPKFDDLSSRETGIENPQGYRMVEFPIYNAIFGAFYKYLPILSLEIYGRLTTAIFSLITIAVIYYLALKESSRPAAIAASMVYAVFPYFVFFSRVVLPESTAVGFVMLAIYFAYRFTEDKRERIVFMLLSALSFAFAVLAKPTAIFYAFAIMYLYIRHYEFNVFKKWHVYLYPIIALVPFALWRLYILQFPEGIPASAWLIRQVQTFEGPKDIFFRPAFFRWIFYERLGLMMFGVYASMFFVLGIIARTKKYFLHSILFSALLYVFTFQGGNVQHEYYQTIMFPALALFTGLGIAFIINNTEKYLNPIITYIVLVIVLVASLLFSYYNVKGFYAYPNDLVQIAKLIQTFTKEDDKIVTDRTGDTTLLYLANRRGSPSTYKEPAEFKKMGYKYIVSANAEYIQKLKDLNYDVVVENDRFALFKL